LSHNDPNLQDAADLEAMAATLEASGTYRVLRKLAPRLSREPPPGMSIRQGLFVDTETTGLDPVRDEIIELAMVPFAYGLDGEVYAVGEPFQQLREPSKPIPPEITAITGIDDAMVAGHTTQCGHRQPERSSFAHRQTAAHGGQIQWRKQRLQRCGQTRIGGYMQPA
jgi:DNA polymerase-3 subunit epsilon